MWTKFTLLEFPFMSSAGPLHPASLIWSTFFPEMKIGWYKKNLRLKSSETQPLKKPRTDCETYSINVFNNSDDVHHPNKPLAYINVTVWRSFNPKSATKYEDKYDTYDTG